MPNLLDILRNTPLWVFALFALLVALGVVALRRRTVAPWRLLVVPAVFITWGVITLARSPAGLPIAVLDWLLAGLVGAAVAWLATRMDGVRFERATGLVEVPGSIVPLVRNLLIFGAKYGLAVAMAVAPAQQASLALWDLGVSGLSAGYFVGWLLKFALHYRATPFEAPAAGAT